MPPLVTRRRFLAAAGVGLVAAPCDGFLVEPGAIDVTRHDVPVAGLPDALAGLRVALVTDVHLDGGVHRAARALVERLGAERPEIVVLAGDICNDRDDLADLAAWARDARGTLATFATFGNWEHDAHITRPTLEAAYARAGVELLVNSAATVSVRGTAKLAIVGLDDPVKGKPDAETALARAGAAEGDPVILSLHAPGYVDRLPRGLAPAPAVILAGHTHGGQIRLPFYTPYTPYGSGRFVSGWYRDTVAPLYVARGVGTVAVRARLFCRPELPVFTLQGERRAGSG